MNRAPSLLRPAIIPGRTAERHPFRTAFHLLAALAALASSSFFAGCGGPDTPPPAAGERATPVAAIVMELRDDVEDRRWAGTLAPLRIHPLEAPVAGRVVSVAVTDGATVAQGADILRLEGLDQEARMEILVEREARLREELDRWRELAAAGAAGPGAVVAAELRHSEAGRLELEVAPGTRLPVARVVQAPDPQPGFVQVDLYPQLDGAPTSGGVTVRYRSPLQAMVVPWTSVATDGTRSWVAVATPDPASDGYRVERRTVELGEAMADGVQVLDGVEPGEWVLRYEPRSHPEGRLVEPRGSGTAPPMARGGGAR